MTRSPARYHWATDAPLNMKDPVSGERWIEMLTIKHGRIETHVTVGCTHIETRHMQTRVAWLPGIKARTLWSEVHCKWITCSLPVLFFFEHIESVCQSGKYSRLLLLWGTCNEWLFLSTFLYCTVRIGYNISCTNLFFYLFILFITMYWLLAGQKQCRFKAFTKDLHQESNSSPLICGPNVRIVYKWNE